MNVRDAAQQYIDRGWQVALLREQSKKCVHDDWLTRTYTAADFTDTSNIGLKSIQGLVDIDCDCAEAVFMAEAFLPRTRAIYGRKGRPRSHWLFRCPEITEPVAYKDLILKKNVLEVRVKHQSMAPPSIHPDTGETIEWDSDDLTELGVEKALLLRMSQLTTTGAMMARYYNPPGARHDWGVALCGFLRRLNVTQAEAERLFTQAGKWAQDEKVKDRLDAVRTTWSVSEDTPTTGAKTLKELMEEGEGFVATLYKIWGSEAGGVSQTKLDALNKKHAVIQLQGGKVKILTEAYEDDKLQIRFSSRQEFALIYTDKVQVGVTSKGVPIIKPIAEAWLEHKKRRYYNGIELAPNGKCNAGYYNLWQGFSVKPVPGDWSLFKEHIGLLANGVQEHVDYILAWMADCVQHPERPGGIALAFKGRQGTGKSTFATWFGSLFGPHFLHLDSEHRLLGNFNAHLQNTIVVLADEAVWAGGKQGLGALKRMITERTLQIEQKGIDSHDAKNMLHMIIASNEEWFVPTGFDNRRFAIFRVNDARQNQWRFFEAVRRQLFEQGGLAALLHDLLALRSSVDLRDIPLTDELQEQKRHSMSSRQAWWYEQLISGAPWAGAEELPSDGQGGERMFQIDPTNLYSAYVTALRVGDNRANPGFEGAVGRFMRTMLPETFPRTVQHGGKRYWILPSLAESRIHFDDLMKFKNDWPLDVDKSNDPSIPF